MSPEWTANLVAGGKNDPWDLFCAWADRNGVGPVEEDWREWWNCFEAGAIAAVHRPVSASETAAQRSDAVRDMIAGMKRRGG